MEIKLSLLGRGGLLKNVLLVCLCSLSFFIFIWYLKMNYSNNYYDEHGYINIAVKIANEGLFSINEPLRTYLYPLFISVFYKFSNADLIFTKILMSIFQYIIYVGTVFSLAIFARNYYKSIYSFYIVITIGLLNPYLLQSTSLFLTDILSSCFIILSLLIFISKKINNSWFLFLAITLLYSAVMIRPSAAIFLVILFVIFIVRVIKCKDVNMIKVTVFGVLLLVIFIPQLYNNVVNFNHWTPLIHDNLFKAQSSWAVQYIKYGTVVIPNETPQLYYHSPFNFDQGTTIFSLVYTNFIAFIVMFFSHIFGVLDWGNVEAYIRSFYPNDRIIASLFLYTGWFVIFLGIIDHFRDMKKMNFKFFSLLFAGIVYTFFIATTCIESRFGYPIFLIFLPFSGGFHLVVKRILKVKRNAMLYIILFITFIVSFLTLSFVFDLQTGRIDWFDYFGLKFF